MPGQEPRRHPETFAYRCFLSDLTRFTKFRRAGPAQAGSSIPHLADWCKERVASVGTLPAHRNSHSQEDQAYDR